MLDSTLAAASAQKKPLTWASVGPRSRNATVTLPRACRKFSSSMQDQRMHAQTHGALCGRQQGGVRGGSQGLALICAQEGHQHMCRAQHAAAARRWRDHRACHADVPSASSGLHEMHGLPASLTRRRQGGEAAGASIEGTGSSLDQLWVCARHLQHHWSALLPESIGCRNISAPLSPARTQTGSTDH
jgi:hypothetical protein